MSSKRTEAALAKADEIEAELKRLGWWQQGPLRPEQYDFKHAFGMDTMVFQQWLQFILLERVRSIAAEGGQFPSSSSVGVMAARELDGYPEAEKLVSLLGQFDALFR